MRLKYNIQQHEEQRQVIFSELQQQDRPLIDNMITNQGNLELLLKRDKKQVKWKCLLSNSIEFFETGDDPTWCD